MIVTALLLAGIAGLFVLGLIRPWIALIVLLTGLPVNSLFTQVIPYYVRFSPTQGTMVGAWHDALIGGIALAAIASVARSRAGIQRVIWPVLAMVVIGLVYVVVSPYRLTAAYLFSVLYLAPLLLVSILLLVRRAPMPSWVVRLAASGFVISAMVGALFTWIQVYVLSFWWIQKIYTEPGAQIHHSYLATGLQQPRGIGLLNSPNELGAVNAIALVLALTPALGIPSRLRWWIASALGLGLLLSYSRSGMLAAGVGVLTLASFERHRIALALRTLTTRRGASAILLPVLIAVVVTSVVLPTSGGATLANDTVAGTEPSAAGRSASVSAGLTVLTINPFGLGLGTAGPKAARFGELAGRPRILTETWYILYGIQVGLIGLAVLVAIAVLLAAQIWRRRDRPVARAALAMGVGLGAGALFIPIIEEPTVWMPLWAFTALALASSPTSGWRPRVLVSAEARSYSGEDD